jgi:hypothetical protein
MSIDETDVIGATVIDKNILALLSRSICYFFVPND